MGSSLKHTHTHSFLSLHSGSYWHIWNRIKPDWELVENYTSADGLPDKAATDMGRSTGKGINLKQTAEKSMRMVYERWVCVRINAFWLSEASGNHDWEVLMHCVCLWVYLWSHRHQNSRRSLHSRVRQCARHGGRQWLSLSVPQVQQRGKGTRHWPNKENQKRKKNERKNEINWFHQIKVQKKNYVRKNPFAIIRKSYHTGGEFSSRFNLS